MSLQAQVFLNTPSQLLNAAALLVAVAGSWLLLATHWRQQLALARQLANADRPRANAKAEARATATARLDGFFLCFGLASLGLAVLMSWASRFL